MDLQKEREAFEKECRLLCYKGNMVMSNLGSFYNNEQTNWMWQMWLSAKTQAVPEGFVLVPREMPKSFDEGLYVYSNSISIVDECSDSFIPMSDINHAEVWKLVIEAQEPTND